MVSDTGQDVILAQEALRALQWDKRQTGSWGVPLALPRPNFIFSPDVAGVSFLCLLKRGLTYFFLVLRAYWHLAAPFPRFGYLELRA